MKWSKLGKFSAYARAENHLVQQTVHGAVVTCIGVLVAVILVWTELGIYFKPNQLQTMGVDLTRNELMRITLDMTFPALACPALSLDISDISGEGTSDTSVARNGEIHKWRIDPKGNRIAMGEYIPPKHPGGNMGWVMRRPQDEVNMLNQMVDAHEGCNIVGWIDVQRVAGNFHMSIHADNFMMLRKTQEDLAQAIRDHMYSVDESTGSMQIPTDTTSVNVSHTIRKLAFGAEFPGQVNPLDGFERIVDVESGIFKYFLKVVPTEFQRRNGRHIPANQYAVTEYYSALHKGEMQLPAVWFMYDFSPITVTISEKRRSFLHLLTRLCAVVGGVFAVTGMLDRWVHRLVTWVSKQL
ncbi:hypothetical protein WJX72_007060 [[Myrmecia] bisecta]|uniref:Endoplasmic reticulum-Golgi intermediate compartment protein 3 n=1 Tax=[Myrmecia] bisecta TaxID=41462 RepID=A0AAW1PHF1_9CHLO